MSLVDLSGLSTTAAPLESVVQEVIEDLGVVSRMSSLQAQHCLTVGSVQHRVNHLWRMIPGGENSIFGDLMRKYD